jgi:EAL domain-containing protein (putative c-di-GMP-specific phosphodiesterase class I)
VVAEGLETEQQEQWLVDHGCDLLQGYLLSKPLPPVQLYAWLNERLRQCNGAAPA